MPVADVDDEKEEVAAADALAALGLVWGGVVWVAKTGGAGKGGEMVADGAGCTTGGKEEVEGTAEEAAAVEKEERASEELSGD